MSAAMTSFSTLEQFTGEVEALARRLTVEELKDRQQSVHSVNRHRVFLWID